MYDLVALRSFNQSLTVYVLDKDMIPLKTLGTRLTDRGTTLTGEGNIELRWQPREGHKGCTSHKEDGGNGWQQLQAYCISSYITSPH